MRIPNKVLLIPILFLIALSTMNTLIIFQRQGVITGLGTQAQVSLIISGLAPFDINISVTRLLVKQQDSAYADVSLTTHSAVGQNVTLRYWIEDNSGNEYNSAEQIVFVDADSTKNLTISLTVPSVLGDMNFYAMVLWENQNASAFDRFVVIPEKIPVTPPPAIRPTSPPKKAHLDVAALPTSVYSGEVTTFNFYHIDARGKKIPFSDTPVSVYRQGSWILVETGFTDEDGNFNFTPTESGRYKIELIAKGFSPIVQEFDAIVPEKVPVVEAPALPKFSIKTTALPYTLITTALVLVIIANFIWLSSQIRVHFKRKR